MPGRTAAAVVTARRLPGERVDEDGSMAMLLHQSASIRVRLGPWERLGAMRGDLVIPRSAVVSMRPTDDVVRELRGRRSPGYGMPGHAAIGTYRGRGYKDFVAVYWKRRRGIVITLQGQDYDRVVISTGETVEVLQRIAEAV
jgi:hypothetical protein